MMEIEYKSKKIRVGVKGENIYIRRRKIIMCSCTGNTEKTATPLVCRDGNVFCPNCGTKAEIIKTPQDFEDERIQKEKEELENLHIRLVAHDWECGFNFYGLSTRIPIDAWRRVKHLFNYNYWNEELELDFGSTRGWTTFRPLEVQEILSDMIKEENRIDIDE